QQPLCGGDLAWSVQLRGERFDHRPQVATVMRPRSIPLTMRPKLLCGVLTNRFELVEADLLTAAGVDRQQMFIEQRLQRGLEVRRVVHRANPVEHNATDEDRNLAKQGLLSGLEELVAPGDGVAECAVAR